jgi:hypothetical protein
MVHRKYGAKKHIRVFVYKIVWQVNVIAMKAFPATVMSDGGVAMAIDVGTREVT